MYYYKPSFYRVIRDLQKFSLNLEIKNVTHKIIVLIEANRYIPFLLELDIYLHHYNNYL